MARKRTEVFVVVQEVFHEGSWIEAIFVDEQRAWAFAYTRAVEYSEGMRPVSDGYRLITLHTWDDDMRWGQYDVAYYVQRHELRIN